MAGKKKSEPEAAEQDTSQEGGAQADEAAPEEGTGAEQEAPPAEAAQAEEPPAQEPQGEATQAPEAPQPEPTKARAPQGEAPAAEAPQAESAQVQDAHPDAAQAPEPELAQADEAASSEASEEPAQAPTGPAADASEAEEEATGEAAERSARAKPSVPGAHLEVDIVPEGVDPLGRGEEYEDPYAIEEDEVAPVQSAEQDEEAEEVLAQPIASAAIDLARHGIRVNGVAPGVADTPLAELVVHNERLAPQYLKTIPLGRFAQPVDVANCALFLASDEAAYVTGQTIVIDGGQTLGIPGDLGQDPEDTG